MRRLSLLQSDTKAAFLGFTNDSSEGKRHQKSSKLDCKSSGKRGSTMGLPQADFSQMDTQGMSLPYPAQTKQAAGKVDGVPTDVMVISFSDKIMVTITQAGRLAQWVNKLLLSSR